MDILQFIGKKLDPTKKVMPTVEESRSFMYLQELLLLFGKKEKVQKKLTKKAQSMTLVRVFL
jgi:hypothetical protein